MGLEPFNRLRNPDIRNMFLFSFSATVRITMNWVRILSSNTRLLYLQSIYYYPMGQLCMCCDPTLILHKNEIFSTVLTKQVRLVFVLIRVISTTPATMVLIWPCNYFCKVIGTKAKEHPNNIIIKQTEWYFSILKEKCLEIYFHYPCCMYFSLLQANILDVWIWIKHKC